MLRRILLCASFLAAPLRAEPLRIVTPAGGATLRGGQFVTLSWSAQRLPRGAEEWEAFLSLDGGRYYAVRLTPHLDIRVRSFQVLIPNVDSDDVRLLVRTGDERNETIIEMPQRLRIRAEAQVVAISQNVVGHGESARPNEPPVVQWSVGDHVESSAPPAALHAIAKPPAPTQEIAPTALRTHCAFYAIKRLARPRSPLAARRSPVIDLLLQTSRLNV